MHLERRAGSRDSAIAYSRKDSTRSAGPWSLGDEGISQGKSKPLKRAYELLKAGCGDRELFEEVPEVAFRYQQGIRAARAALAHPRDKAITPTILIWWGDSGTGKTRKAVEEYPEAYILTKPNGNGVVWFDGYYGQKVIIFDEFYGWVPYDLMLRILDRYPLKLQIKGGMVECQATTFIITSNKPWTDWYAGIDDKSAMERRIKEWGMVTKFSKLELVDVN